MVQLKGLNNEKAFYWYMEAAKQNNYVAQRNVGLMYATGDGVPRDYDEAYNWFKKSAEQGYSKAQVNLAYLYLHGKGVKKNLQEAVNWYKKAEIRKRLQEYLNTIERHYGVTPIIYTGADYYANYLGEDFDEYPLWVAHYLQRNKPRINRPWNFWQFAETGRVDGIISKVDFNVFSGDSAEFHALRIQ